jgi:ABC-type transport system substrate-binding protein
MARRLSWDARTGAVGRRWTGVALVVVALAAGSFGVAPAAASARRAAQVDTSGILHVGEDLVVTGVNGSQVDFLAASTGASPQWNQWMNLIYDNLVRVAPNGSALPGLATAWSFPDPLTIELKLRTGVKFQDGTPFNAEAVKFSFDRTLNSDLAKNNHIDKNFLQVDNVEVVDDNTVRIHLKTPVQSAVFDLLHKPEAYVVSPTAVQKEGADFAQHPVGAGPYKLTEFTPEKVVSLRKWDGYWEGTNKSVWRLAGIDFDQLTQGPQFVNGLRSGAVDLIRVTEQQTADALKSDSSVKLVSQASDSSMYHFDLCVTDPVFKNLKVRQAIAYAINRDELNQAANGGNGVTSDQVFPKGSAFYFPEFSKYPYNPKKARQLIKQAKVPSDYSFDVATFPSPAFEPTMDVLQQQFARVGLKMNIKEDANFVENVLITPKYPAYMVSSIRSSTGKVASMNPATSADFCHYNSKAVTDAITQIDSTADAAKQKTAWRVIAQAMAKDAFFFPLYFSPVQVAYNSDKVGGVLQLFDQGEGANFRTIYLKK